MPMSMLKYMPMLISETKSIPESIPESMITILNSCPCPSHNLDKKLSWVVLKLTGPGQHKKSFVRCTRVVPIMYHQNTPISRLNCNVKNDQLASITADYYSLEINYKKLLVVSVVKVK